MTFTGFPTAAITFYEGLAADNSRSFWQAHRADYEDHVRGPLVALLDELAGEFGTAKVFRPQRDTRFSPDKAPYKTYQGAFVTRSENIGWYVQISAAGLLASGGVDGPVPAQVERYRAAVDTEDSGAALASTIAGLRAAGYTIGGEQLKSRPRGYPPDHPRLELLRHRSLSAERRWPPEPWLHSTQAAERIRQTWRDLVPLCEWLSHHVGGPA
jgi:uncharacterized protein (TIGR02453 family)